MPNHISDIPGWAQYRVEESWRSGSVVGAVADHEHPLNCQIWWFEEVSDYLFLGRRHPHICKGSPLVVYKWSPNQCVKDAVNTN